MAAIVTKELLVHFKDFDSKQAAEQTKIILDNAKKGKGLRRRAWGTQENC